MAIILASSNVPEFFTAPVTFVDKLRALTTWAESVPEEIQETRLADCIVEEVLDKQYAIVDALDSVVAFKDALGDDGVFNILRLFTQDGKVFLDCIVETSDSCEDYEIEVRAE